MAAATGALVTMQSNGVDWANEHLDYKYLNSDIDPPVAQLELAIRQRAQYQGANHKHGLMLLRCGGFEWTLWTPVCTQTSNTFRQWVADKYDPRRPMRLLEFSLPDTDPYVLDRVLFYHLNLRVEVPDEKHITMATFDRARPTNVDNNGADGFKCNLTTSMMLIKLYDVAWKLDDNLLKEVVLSMLRTRLFKLQYTVPEFLEAVDVVSNRREPNERNKKLTKIFLTAAVLRAEFFAFADDHQDAFFGAQSSRFNKLFTLGCIWYERHYRDTRQTVMAY